MTSRRPRRPAFLLSITAALVLGLSAPASAISAVPAPSAPPVPDRMASLGDSITRAANACAFLGDCVNRSWSTGPSQEVNSHYARLKARNGSLTAYNDAVSGAKIAALAGQANSAVSQRAGYVTILMGGNDACTSSESTMTSVADYETRLRAAMATLRQGLPDALIFVASVPDAKQLWQVGKDNASARAVWSTFNICQSMLANPTSTSAADEARRNRVRQRVIDYNRVLAAVCAENPNCRFDGNAVFAYRFTLAQVSSWDYFHPNTDGQAVIARETYARSFWPTAVRPAA